MLNQRFVTVDMTQIEDAMKEAEIAFAKLRKIVDRYNRAAEAARRSYDGGESQLSQNDHKEEARS